MLIGAKNIDILKHSKIVKQQTQTNEEMGGSKNQSFVSLTTKWHIAFLILLVHVHVCTPTPDLAEDIFVAIKSLLTFLEHVDFIFPFYILPKCERQSPTSKMMSKCILQLKFQGTFWNVKKHCGVLQAEVQSHAAWIEQLPIPVEVGNWLAE